MSPVILVQLSSAEKVSSFRDGLDDAVALLALGLPSATFSTLPGVDALYMSFTRAERFGSRPLAPYAVSVLPTSDSERQRGTPPYIITGLALNDGDPNVADFYIPLLVRRVLGAAATVNQERPGAIRSIGFLEFELTRTGEPLREIARLMASALRDA